MGGSENILASGQDRFQSLPSRDGSGWGREKRSPPESTDQRWPALVESNGRFGPNHIRIARLRFPP